MQSRAALVLLLLWANAALGQGTVHFSWQGTSFQASFDVTGAEMLPGGTFGSPLFYSSWRVVDPDGLVFTYDPVNDSAAGGPTSNGGWGASAVLVDLNVGEAVFIDALDVPDSTSRILEKQIYGTGQRQEFSNWSALYVAPEPSAGGLLVVGLVALEMKRRLAPRP